MDVSKQPVRTALMVLVLAIAVAVGALVTYWGSDGGLSYTEPQGNPSLTGTKQARSDLVGAETPGADVAVTAVDGRRAAPGFGLSDGAGRSLHLEDFKGRVVLVNLWATWCPPCIAEMPDLDQLQGRLGGDGFQVVAVSLDRGGAVQVKRWFDRNQIGHLGLYAADPAQFQGAVLPTSILLDKQGRVAWHGVGMRDWLGAEVAAAIQALMAEPG